MKKIIVFLCVFMFTVVPVFSGPLANLSDAEYKLLDTPMVNGITYFQQAMFSFAGIARTLGTFLAAVCILWNAFRLWFGMQEIKKAAIDIIFKFTLFIFLFNSYPLIVDGVYDFAVDIGMRAGSGYNTLTTEFEALRSDLEKKVLQAQNELPTLLKANPVMTESMARELARRTIISREEQEAFLAGLSDRGVTVLPAMDKEQPNYAIGSGAWNRRKAEYNKSASRLDDFAKSVGKGQEELAMLAKDLPNAVVTLRALNEVFTENSLYDEDGIRDERVPKYLFSPYYVVNGKQTNILSPGAMLKISVIIADVISRRIGETYDHREGVIIQADENDKWYDRGLRAIQQFLFSLLITIGIILATAFFVIQYVMCVFEYSIVTAVGVIFVPFCLWDGTKSFAAKLVTLFTAYFIKLLVMILCLFWVFATFIKMGIYLMTDVQPVSLLNITYFLFTTLLCWVVTQNGPAVAVTVLNGSPQLSMGEFLHAAGTAAGGAILAQRAAKAAGSAIHGVHKSGQEAVRNIGTNIATAHGASSAIDEMKQFEGLTPQQKFLKKASMFGSLTMDRWSDNAKTFFTGLDSKKGSKEDYIANMGAGHDPDYRTKTGVQSYRDAEENAKKSATAKAGKSAEADKNSKPANNPPPDKNAEAPPDKDSRLS
jgi:type IV secretion system protein TrbL